MLTCHYGEFVNPHSCRLLNNLINKKAVLNTPLFVVINRLLFISFVLVFTDGNIYMLVFEITFDNEFVR